MGACFGFLWWNTAPAKIFMGDTGSLALGGALAGLAITTRTELLAVILAGLFLIEVLSVMIQVGFFKTTRQRVFRMAPLHHHFEMVGWQEITVTVRFWIIAGLFVALGLGIFYAEWVVGTS
jgi:phospho-N-acetylmuramoyl-pentapeptide-transferase